MPKLKILMEYKKILIGDDFCIDFNNVESTKKTIDLMKFRNTQESTYLFKESVVYLEEDAEIFINFNKEKINILFSEYFHLSKNILESKVVQSFLVLHPFLEPYYTLKSAPVLEFKSPELAWESLSFVYDSKQASIRLDISF